MFNKSLYSPIEGKLELEKYTIKIQKLIKVYRPISFGFNRYYINVINFLNSKKQILNLGYII